MKPYSVPPGASRPVPKDFQSFSIELSFWPDFAGNLSNPNTFSKALLENLEQYTGHAPLLRIGGGTQPCSCLVSQEEGIMLQFDKPGTDQPSSATIGPAFFEYYHTLSPNIKYVHGFNFNCNLTDGLDRLEVHARQAFKSIGDKLQFAEVGNEADLTSGRTRPIDITPRQFVHEWSDRVKTVTRAFREIRGKDKDLQFLGPSFAWDDYVRGTLEPNAVFENGYGAVNRIGEISMHNYMNSHALGRLGSDSRDLQFLLMNHSSVVNTMVPHYKLGSNLSSVHAPYTLGECNSISGQGVNGVTDGLGAALWNVDFALWNAANNIRRISSHQGYKYRYGAWDPNSRGNLVPSTRAPYYGNVMVAKAIGRDKATQITPIALGNDIESAYAIYGQGKLARIVVLNLNMALQNATAQLEDKVYSFRVARCFRGAKVERLEGPGSDGTSGITFSGKTYDFEVGQGRPVKVKENEKIAAKGGYLKLRVPASSAALLTLF